MTSDGGSYLDCPPSVWIPTIILTTVLMAGLKFVGIIFQYFDLHIPRMAVEQLADMPWIMVFAPIWFIGGLALIIVGIFFLIAWLLGKDLQ